MLLAVAWNTEETKRRLKQAATEQFAADGVHGTTMEAIARRAGINKERLYNYFGNKEELFATVLADELAKVAAAVPLESLRDEDIGEWAGRVYDYHSAHPQLIRLLHWEALAYGQDNVPDERARTDYYARKTQTFAQAQRDGILTHDIGPDHLLFLLLAISTWWPAVPQLAHMITGAKSGNRAERTRRRLAVTNAARRLALESPTRPPHQTQTQSH
jgi:AcrR family transcriptional regulator